MTEATKNEILDEITALLANKGLITSEVEEIWYTIGVKRKKRCTGDLLDEWKRN